MTKRKSKAKAKKATPKNYLYYLLPLAAVLITAVLYAPVANFELFTNWDDDTYILNNPDVLNFDIKAFFTSFYVANYQPITMLVYGFTASLGMKAGHFHLVNLFFHLLNILLVYYFAFRLSGKQVTAFITALFFGIHPLHVESVAWVSELKDLLYTFFFVGGLIAYTYWIEKKVKKHYVLALILMLLAVLSKPAAVVFPLILPLIDYYKNLDFLSKARLIEKAPFFLLAFVFGLLAMNSQGASGALDTGLPQQAFSPSAILYPFYGFAFYLLKAFLPFNLSPLHPYPNALSLPFYLAPLLPFLLVFLSFKAKVLRKEILFGLGFFLVNLILILKLIPFGYAVVAERYTYVPYIGVFFLCGEIFHHYKNKNIQAGIGGGLAILAVICIFSSHKILPAYQNTYTLFSRVIEAYPDYFAGYYIRSNAGIAKNDFSQAFKDANKAIELNPKFPNAYHSRALANELSNGDLHKSFADYDKAIQLNPNHQLAYSNRSFIHYKLNRFQEALKDAQKAVSVNPTYSAYYNLGLSYYGLKQYKESIPAYDNCLKINPNYGVALYNRGVSKYMIGDKKGCCADWEMAKAKSYAQAQEMLQQYCR